MSDPRNPKAGLDALLTPDNCVLILIDHQPFQVAGLRSHDTQSMINNVVGLAKSARIFGVPTLLTTVLEERGGYIIKPLQDVFPEQKPINRTFINTWEDERVVEWVKNTGTDASGGVSVEAHEMAIQRMVQAGAVPITWTVLAAELQRDWARTTTVAPMAQILVEHAGVVGTSFTWEQQLLATAPAR